MAVPKPLILIILDGFGVSPEKRGNPTAEANLPTFNFFEKNFPFTLLQASGVAVGLPWGEAGNSEVGHLTIGAGHVIYSHLPRIIYSIYDGSFSKNEAFMKAAEHVRSHDSSLHIAGLISSGSVHSYFDHLLALLEFAKKESLPRVFIHVFTDGKDAPPAEGEKILASLEEKVEKEFPNVKIASIMGRTFAMDREEKWSLVKSAYELMTQGRGTEINSAPGYLAEAYENGLTDDFIEPAVMVTGEQKPAGLIKENDALIFFNFREDSMREITRAFLEDNFSGFERKKIDGLLVVTMTEYQKGLSAIPAFPPLDVKWPLARILGEAGLRHLHIAETTKYAHVTYFFNGGVETPFPGEERILVQSSHDISHFDEAPEMGIDQITDRILENFDTQDLILANFANADMVGHTGNYQACVKAAEALDGALKKIAERVLAGTAVMLVTADHGNIELKRNPLTGEKLTEHSLNPVPFFIIGKDFHLKNEASEKEIEMKKKEVRGILTDVAPTVLALLGLKKSQEMTGKSLLDVLV